MIKKKNPTKKSLMEIEEPWFQFKIEKFVRLQMDSHKNF
jgi:hypothetical protein